MSERRPTSDPSTTPVLRVVTDDGRQFLFAQAFHAGRGKDCEVRIYHDEVSRHHLEVAFEGGQWTVTDLQSGNGVFVDGERVDFAPVDGAITVTLGHDGPMLTLEVEPDPDAPSVPTRASKPKAKAKPKPKPAPDSDDSSLHQRVTHKYFGPEDTSTPAGPQTLLVRRVLKERHRQQRRWFTAVVGALVAALAVTGGYAYYKHRQLEQQRDTAVDLFYAMKALDFNIANVEKAVASSGSTQGQAQLGNYRAQRRAMERTYDQFLVNLDLYNRPLNEQELLILRVTRLLGECDIAAPPEYINEVMTYINRWRATGRYARGIALAHEKGYTKRIADEFLAQNLPPQFFYLALQESDFDPLTTGPPTRYGYAKGMWQFIPETGKRYGLAIGPLANVPRPDAADDRHKWDRATVAAAKYIKDIYATDAQASALLVMASYNWGEHRVIDLVRTLTNNPRERNFWKLQEKYRTRIPPETYNYVFSIVSAAVIGENPRLFGFTLDPPLGFLEQQTRAGL
jgi:membrane-bound lytic murein transglycosylase D